MSDQERIEQLEKQLALVVLALRANETLWQTFTDDWATCNPTFGSLQGYNNVVYRAMPEYQKAVTRAGKAQAPEGGQ
jgi:hypothetical protein